MAKNLDQNQQTTLCEQSGLAGSPEFHQANESANEELQQRYELLLQQYHQLQHKYNLLANSKAGRFTLAYWKIKDRIRNRIITFLKEGFAKKNRKPLSVVQLPSITVIIPSYRETPYLEQALSSVLEQDYPAEKMTVILSVNGEDRKYYETLKMRYVNCPCVRIIYTEKRGAAAARNMALSETETECVCFLDDDDWISKAYLRTMAVRMYKDVTVVCAPLCDCYSDTSDCNWETYINKALSNAGPGLHRNYLQLTPLLSSLPAKLYRTEMLKEKFQPMDEQVRSSEDVLYWAENYSAIYGYIYLCEAEQEEYYVRRMTAGSLSRPLSHEWPVYISDRLGVIDRLAVLLDKAATEEERKFISHKMSAQRNLLEQYVAAMDEPQREKAEEMVACFKGECLSTTI